MKHPLKPFKTYSSINDTTIFISSIVSIYPPPDPDKLNVIGQSTNIPKLSAQSYEYVTNTPGFPAKARHVSKYIKKGIWRNKPMFVLTLIERATCNDCTVCSDICYGDNMARAKRFDPTGVYFKESIISDLALLAKRYPLGYVVRLHELGDFFSVPYVLFWENMLKRFPKLLIFGYTHQNESIIGKHIDRIFLSHPGRFFIMASDPKEQSIRPRAIVIKQGDKIPEDVTICPQITKKTPSCSTCGLCMNGKTRIGFPDHSRKASKLLLQIERR